MSKISKAGKGHLAKWRSEQHGVMLDSYMRGLAQKSRQKFGHTAVWLSTDDEVAIVGIPMPFSMEYLFCNDAFPFGLVMQIVGMPSTCKSALGYEIMRWFRNAGGGSFLEEVETKHSAPFMRSIVGYGPDEVNVIRDVCQSVEDWQQKLLFNINQHKEGLTWTDRKKKIPGPGRTIPTCFVVDSVSGKLSMETQEKVNEQGYHSRSHPIEAMSITGFTKTVPQQLDGWPFSLVLVNHLKMGKDDMGHDKRNITGGSGLIFQESFELENKKFKRIESADWEGKLITIRCIKNSFGPEGRSINARMLWWQERDEKTGVYGDQITRWDWHWSTISLLTSITGMYANNLKESGFHLEAPKKSDVENTAWSKNLGMEKEDAIPWSEMGKKLSEDKKLMDTIRQCLSIRRCSLLEGDYLKQLEGLQVKMA